MPVVTLRRDGDIAVIVIDNPPVNAQNNAVRAGLVEAFRQARDDAGVKAIVLTCAGRTFVAGSDIAEFGAVPQRPSTPEVIAAIEGAGKPTVAALFGTVLGGGFELALACHFRIAAPGTKLGLPEIKLGLMPGAGGTQLLPRLAGLEKAAAMILSGDPIGAEDGIASGIIDELFESDPATAGIAFAKSVNVEKRPAVLARDRTDRIAALRNDPQQVDAIIAAAAKRGRGGPHAPARAAQALRDAVLLPIGEGLARERAAFLQLVDSLESKALRHLFFAEREATRMPDLPAGVAPREVRHVAVVGAGTMGGGIAMAFANAGIPVRLVEVSAEALMRGLQTIEKNYRFSAARGGLASAEVDRRMTLIEGATDLEATGQADLVIEAVFEDMALKLDLFGRLDRIAKPDAVLATNTSYLDVNAIAQATSRPESVLGMHFFSPANVMRLLETVRGEKTSPAALATAISVGRKIGKVPVVVGVCPGFVGNRMLRLRGIEVERVLLEGALPQEIDGAMMQFGFPMGPLAVSDMGGLDIGWRARKASGLTAPIADRLCEMGRFGQKTGRGFYRYEQGSRTPHRDEEVELLILETAHAMGIKRRPFSHQEIQERLLFPMVNEGARILDEGIASRAGDIDVIWVNGYGFPNWRGGPMFYAGTIGLEHVCERLDAFAAQTGDERHKPCALLKQLATEGRTFG